MMKLSTKQTATDSGRVVKTVRLAAYFVQPAVHNVGVDAVGECNRGNGRFVLATLLDNLGFEFWAVVTPLGASDIALVRHSVHDLHSGHYRFDLTSDQYGMPSRLQFSERHYSGKKFIPSEWFLTHESPTDCD